MVDFIEWFTWKLQHGNTQHLFPVKTWCNSAILRIWLVDLRVCIQKALHGSVAIKGSYIEQHLPGVKGEEERATEKEREWSLWEPTDTSQTYQYQFCSRAVQYRSKILSICSIVWNIYQVFPSSISQVGMFPVIITSGSCSWRLALAVSLLLMNSLVGMISLHAAFCKITKHMLLVHFMSWNYDKRWTAWRSGTIYS